jgi:hypothetical protein
VILRFDRTHNGIKHKLSCLSNDSLKNIYSLRIVEVFWTWRYREYTKDISGIMKFSQHYFHNSQIALKFRCIICITHKTLLTSFGPYWYSIISSHLTAYSYQIIINFMVERPSLNRTVNRWIRNHLLASDRSILWPYSKLYVSQTFVAFFSKVF